MIFYLVTGEGRHTIDAYLACWGQRLFRDIQPLTYASASRKRDLPPGTYIFSDIERLNGRRDQATALWDRLHDAGDGYQLLNHPQRSLARYELLEALADAGVNQYRAYPAADGQVPNRFPVFLRRRNDHFGPRTDLLHDQAELDTAVARFRNEGVNLKPWIIVEFCDTRCPDGLYRKYAVYNVDGTLIPFSMLFSEHWMLKFVDLQDTERLDEEISHLHTDRHLDQLRAIFEIANIDYGRVDFSVVDGKIQVWEINTNPAIVSVRYSRQHKRREVKRLFRQRFEAALRGLLDQDAPSRSNGWALPVDRAVSRLHVAWQQLRATAMYRDLRRWKQHTIGHRRTY